MAYATVVARACDGLVLAESRDDRGHVSGHAMQQATQLLARLHTMSPRCSLEVGGLIFHLLICDGVCYVGIFDYRYPKMLAFTFLEEVRDLFREEMKQRFGTGSVDHRSHIETVEKPYFFVRFDRQLLKKQVEFQDPSSSKAISKMQASTVQLSAGLIDIGCVLPAAQCPGGAASKASDAQAAQQKLPSTAVVACLVMSVALVLLLILAVAAQAHAVAAIGPGCLVLALGAYCLTQFRGSARPRKHGAASFDAFSCVSDYLI